jgi:hypothetical protein
MDRIDSSENSDIWFGYTYEKLHFFWTIDSIFQDNNIVWFLAKQKFPRNFDQYPNKDNWVWRPRLNFKNTERQTKFSVEIFARCRDFEGGEKMLQSLSDNHPTRRFPHTSIDTYNIWIMLSEIATSYRSKQLIIEKKDFLFHRLDWLEFYKLYYSVIRAIKRTNKRRKLSPNQHHL